MRLIVGLLFLVCIALSQTTQVDASKQVKNIVPAAAGTYGDQTHTIQLVIDNNGKIVSLVTVGIQASGSAGVGVGTFAGMTLPCSTPLYIATDQPAGQQIYTCVNGVYVLQGSIDNSGLMWNGGSLGFNPAVWASKINSNNWDGLQTMLQGLSLLTNNPQPTCSASAENTFWGVKSTGPGVKGTLQYCYFDGSVFVWKPIV